jgi:cytochrome c oxidase subunit 1
VLGFGYLLPGFYLTLSLFFGKKASANPWSATGLEWQCPSPPSVYNFETTPITVCGPYEYAIGVDQMGRGLPEPPGPGAADDPASHHGPTGSPGPMNKETHVVG